MFDSTKEKVDYGKADLKPDYHLLLLTLAVVNEVAEEEQREGEGKHFSAICSKIQYASTLDIFVLPLDYRVDQASLKGTAQNVVFNSSYDEDESLPRALLLTL